MVKQADLVLAMHWQGHVFTPEQKARNVSYYESRTVRDSSLSACTQAVMCAEVGHLQLAYEYAHEAALIDLRDLHHNTRDGLHMAALAGSWIALVAGFGGLRDGEGVLALDPMLPEGIRRLRFRLVWRGVRLLVDVDHRRVTYTIRDGSDARLVLRHAGEPVVVTADRPCDRPAGAPYAQRAVSHPAGRTCSGPARDHRPGLRGSPAGVPLLLPCPGTIGPFGAAAAGLA